MSKVLYHRLRSQTSWASQEEKRDENGLYVAVAQRKEKGWRTV